MRVGVIDLGTNTFNLLIADKHESGSFDIVLSTKTAVMLGSDGLDKKILSDEVLQRAFNALKDFKQILDQHNCTSIYGFGTSALRTSTNAHQLITRVFNDLNIVIESISGDDEAEFIYHGVKQAVAFTDENYLVLDIGGGSNEFIIANRNNLLWKMSFPLGSARLLERFKPSNPITPNEIEAINSFLNEQLLPLNEALQHYKVTKLVGASGAFDSFIELLHNELKSGLPQPNALHNLFTTTHFNAIYNTIIPSSREERLNMPGLDNMRVDTIVMATIFTKFTLNLTGVNEIIQSTYSLKEGVLSIIHT